MFFIGNVITINELFMLWNL